MIEGLLVPLLFGLAMVLYGVTKYFIISILIGSMNQAREHKTVRHFVLWNVLSFVLFLYVMGVIGRVWTIAGMLQDAHASPSGFVGGLRHVIDTYMKDFMPADRIELDNRSARSWSQSGSLLWWHVRWVLNAM